MIKRILVVKSLILSFLFCNNLLCENNYENLFREENENVKSSTYFCRSITRHLEKFFSLFNNFDISTRVSRISNYHPFYWELDGSTTFRISFLKIFKNKKILNHNLIFELNLSKVKDLGGRGYDFLERRLGKNIILENKDEDNKDKKFANGAYFFSLLNKTVLFFSVGLEGKGIYNTLFNTDFVKSGFGIRFPIWCSGIFGLVNNLECNADGYKNKKDKGCKKWTNLGQKKPLQGILYNITLYIKPFIYEFDNGFRIDLTWENSINDYRYVFYEIKKGHNDEENISYFNIYNTKKDKNCFFRTIKFFKNTFFLKLKLEIGFNITKLI